MVVIMVVVVVVPAVWWLWWWWWWAWWVVVVMAPGAALGAAISGTSLEPKTLQSILRKCTPNSEEADLWGEVIYPP